MMYSLINIWRRYGEFLILQTMDQLYLTAKDAISLYAFDILEKVAHICHIHIYIQSPNLGIDLSTLS